MSQHTMFEIRTLPELFYFFGKILGPEKRFYWTAIVYGVGISLLSLAIPVSVQMLVNTIVNTGLTQPIVVLSLVLLFLLLIAAGLSALRIHIMDLFGRRFYARMLSEIALRSTYALNPYFEDSSKGPLFNRYFDIMIVMKRVPYLLVGGFSIVLQALFGLILVSMYHPILLGFNLIVVTLIYLTWKIWGRRAIVSSLELSHKKHAAAAWADSLGASNGFFKTPEHIFTAMKYTDDVTANYMQKHEVHFRHHFAQTICFLLIWACGSAALLGIGGWLVVLGELSIGQLVAAELVLSVVFYGISQLGTYFTYFYDLCAAVEELSLFYDIEQEEVSDADAALSGDNSLSFVKARGDMVGIQAQLSFDIASGARVLAYPEHHAIQRICADFLKRHDVPEGGYITLGGTDIQWVKAHSIRQKVIVLDRPNVIELTIQEYLRMSADEVSADDVLDALRTVELESTVIQLQNGMQTRLAATGWPLSIAETMQLKLAAAILAKPKLLILSQLYDVMPREALRKSLDSLQESAGTTVIYFSNRSADLDYNDYLYLGADRQDHCDSFEDLRERATANVLRHVVPTEGGADA
ncbi:toxin secretion ABC transporter ATP-binding protein [Luminiphilus syltensis NOR5-1B]|uniref:Toxin secretion ABC transporter ATP-binding protein n=1 Tax=Luminiphilus syltensis NOR5-1B TaxID=565045 RepID=B8KV28_9GAMM|nr:ABC transporter ATP-binding protein [Luminiphilus syltensis]EED34674.1 toxin secretion ABC transporter ATP-binding protein [Luminiphilus syltensis NOR5-1B]